MNLVVVYLFYYIVTFEFPKKFSRLEKLTILASDEKNSEKTE